MKIEINLVCDYCGDPFRIITSKSDAKRMTGKSVCFKAACRDASWRECLKSAPGFITDFKGIVNQDTVKL